MVMKVVMPAMTSVLTVVLFFESLKSLSNIGIPSLEDDEEADLL
jgi:hypothetical protein